MELVQKWPEGLGALEGLPRPMSGFNGDLFYSLFDDTDKNIHVTCGIDAESTAESPGKEGGMNVSKVDDNE